jgi:hypothetical protein
MRGKGITYDTGFLTAGGSTHEPFNPDLVQSEMQIVRDDLAAEVGVIAFKTAFARWVDDPHEHDLARLIRQALDQLKAATAGTGSSVAG